MSDTHSHVSPLTFVKHEKVHLQKHHSLNEKWTQDRIAEDPSILGLGDLVLIERERRQERAGRLDLLLGDGDQTTRYEVELMLGSDDESHIIRCIEYWDIERRRYPGYDHYAVLVAEDITSRFLNVLSLFSGSIPLVAIQMSAIKIGDQIALHFAKILDQRLLRLDDSTPEPAQSVDRAYWEGRVGAKMIQVADRLLEIVNAKSKTQYQLNYNKHYIGLSDGMRSKNFMLMRPRKSFMKCNFYLNDAQPFLERFEETELSTDTGRKGQLIVNLSHSTVKQHEELIRELIDTLVEEVGG